MYIRPSKIKQKELPRGKETTITHIWLYKDDWTYIKHIAHDQIILDKLLWAKIEISIPELEWLLKEHEIDKLLPKKEARLWEISLF